MNKIKIFTAALAFCALNAGAVIVDENVATVNGNPIFASDYDKVVNAFEEQYDMARPGFSEQPGAKGLIEREVMQKMIEEELLYSAAQKEKVVVRDDEFDMAKLEAKVLLLNLKPELLVPAKGPVKGNIKIIDPKTNTEVKDKELKKRFEDILKKEGLTNNQFEERIKKQLMSRKLVATVILPKAAPATEEEAQALYNDANALLKDSKKAAPALRKEKGEPYLEEVAAIAAKLHMVTAEQVMIGHIFISAPVNMTAKDMKEKQAEAEKIKKEIDKTGDFNAALAKYTEDKQGLAKTGGNMILVKGQVPALDKDAFGLPIGAVSAPIKSDAGFHIIKIKEKKASETLVFDTVKDEFKQYITQQHQQKALVDYMQNLADTADIKINKTFDPLPPSMAQAEPKKEEAKADAKKDAKKADAKKADDKKTDSKKADDKKAASKEVKKDDKKEEKAAPASEDKKEEPKADPAAEPKVEENSKA